MKGFGLTVREGIGQLSDTLSDTFSRLIYLQSSTVELNTARVKPLGVAQSCAWL
jgi:hypothetical protein